MDIGLTNTFDMHTHTHTQKFRVYNGAVVVVIAVHIKCKNLCDFKKYFIAVVYDTKWRNITNKRALKPIHIHLSICICGWKKKSLCIWTTTETILEWLVCVYFSFFFHFYARANEMFSFSTFAAFKLSGAYDFCWLQ